MSGAGMTWRLVVGQMRANRGYFIWTVSLLTLLVATLTYIVVVGATQAALEQQVDGIWRRDLPRGGGVSIFGAENTGDQPGVAPADLRAMIDNAQDAVATAEFGLRTVPIDDYDWGAPHDTLYLLAAYGDSELPMLLETGGVPAELGEIAIARDLARALGLEVGDEFTLYRDVYIADADNPDSGTIDDDPVTARVVGILSPTTMPGFELGTPGGIVSWADVETPGGMLSSQEPLTEGEVGHDFGSYVRLAWAGSDPTLDQYFEGEQFRWSGTVSLPQSAAVWMTLAVVLIAAMIIMSFAVGRAQAAARTQWIATARTLGATRRYIAWSTVLETLVMALFAMGIGVVVGVLAGQAHLSIARAASGLAFAPERVSLHWAIIPTVGIATLLVAVAIAAVPAFWASRVSPVAALKPVNDVTEAELSRRVSPHWLWIPTVLGVAFIVIGNWQPTAPIDGLIVLGLLMASVGVIGLVIEATRAAIPWIGRRMARSPRATILTAGDTLAGRPRLAVAPALISLAAIGGFTLFTLGRAANAQWQSGGFGWFSYGPVYGLFPIQGFLDGATVLAVILGAVMVQLVAAAIFVAHRASTSRETAARRALGLSRNGEARALWWQQVVPQTLGAVLGVVFGTAVFGLWAVLQGFIDEGYMPLAFPYAAMAVGASLAAAGVLLLTAGFTAWLVARIGRSATPLASLNAAT